MVRFSLMIKLLKSRIVTLIFLAILFTLITLIYQLFILSKYKSDHLKFQYNVFGYNAYDFDLNQCNKIIQLKYDIDDLKNMKHSYLAEMNKIEKKRNILNKKVDNLKTSI